MKLSTSLDAGRQRLATRAAAIAIAAVLGVTAISVTPVFAEAVRINARAQVTGFADVVEKVTPAVVSVRVKSRVESTGGGEGFFPFGGQGFDDLPDDHPLKRFFRDFGGENNPFGGGPDHPRRKGPRGEGRLQPTSQGSGFFISEDGFIVTNNHVVDGGAEFTVVLDNGDELDAKLIGRDERTDLAVLKVDASRSFTYVAFADDSKIRVGDWVVAVGNPFGLGGTVTAGIVSARGRDIGAGPYDDFIQIDAAVNRGNSGGPAFNQSGEVVGVNTAIFSPSGGNVGIAFAIPASLAKDVVNKLMTGGTIARGWLGVAIQPVDQDIAESLGLQGTKGALVSDPQDNSPAKAAGIKSGDVITEVDGKAIESPKDLSRLIGDLTPGKEIELTLMRGGKPEKLKLTLGKLPEGDKIASAEAPAPAKPAEAIKLSALGLSVEAAEGGKGLKVTAVEDGSKAEENGIAVGDVILSVNAAEVADAKAAESAVAEAEKAGRKAVLLQVERGEQSRFVALPLAKG
ncbi:MAG: Do family serine endopeptidase [Phyllobacteriaceae bacterium]|nr:Do family serine endopeptidase [Phyllobacteriaceae bacterium]